MISSALSTRSFGLGFEVMSIIMVLKILVSIPVSFPHATAM